MPTHPKPASAPSCAIVVSSFDGFSDLWGPFFTLLFRYWPDCPYPIYLISNSKTYDHPRVTTVAIGEDGKWANNLFIALDQIPATHIIYMQDDYFLTGPVDTSAIQKLVQYAQEKHISCVRLFTSPGPNMPYEEMGLGLIGKNAEYRVSLQAALWDVHALKAVMRRDESGWDMEFKGTVRSQTMNDVYVSVKESAINYTEGVTKGKWNMKAIQHCRKEGVRLERKARGTNYGMYYRAQRDRLRKYVKTLLKI